MHLDQSSEIQYSPKFHSTQFHSETQYNPSLSDSSIISGSQDYPFSQPNPERLQYYPHSSKPLLSQPISTGSRTSLSVDKPQEYSTQQLNTSISRRPNCRSSAFNSYGLSQPNHPPLIQGITLKSVTEIGKSWARVLILISCHYLTNICTRRAISQLILVPIL